MNQGNNQADDSSNATGTEPSGISSILGIGEMFASISRNKAELTGHSASITRSVREDSSAKETEDHNEAAFAGVFAKMLNMMVKE